MEGLFVSIGGLVKLLRLNPALRAISGSEWKSSGPLHSSSGETSALLWASGRIVGLEKNQERGESIAIELLIYLVLFYLLQKNTKGFGEEMKIILMLLSLMRIQQIKELNLLSDVLLMI
jgi:hypothetical protein